MSRFILRGTLLALLLAGVVIGLPAASAGAQEGTPATADCPALTPEVGDAIAQAYSNAFESDTSALAALLADDYVHHWSVGADVTGADSYLAALDAYLEAFSDINNVIEDVVVAEEEGMVIVRYSFNAVQTGELRGIPPSDIETTLTGINLIRVDCGLIVEGWSEVDYFGHLEQIGYFGTPEATSGD